MRVHLTKFEAVNSFKWKLNQLSLVYISFNLHFNMWKLILLPFEWIYSLKFGQMYSHFCWLKTKAILSMILDHENLNLGCVRFHFCSLVSKSAIKSVKTQKMGFLQNTEKVRLKKNLYRRFYIYLSYSTIKSWKNWRAGPFLASAVICDDFQILSVRP